MKFRTTFLFVLIVSIFYGIRNFNFSFGDEHGVVPVLAQEKRQVCGTVGRNSGHLDVSRGFVGEGKNKKPGTIGKNKIVGTKSKDGERQIRGGRSSEPTQPRIGKVGVVLTDPKNKYKTPYAVYALQVSKGDQDFLKTLIAESGLRPDAVNTHNRSGYRDSGVCQINRQYHSKFIDSPDFKDWKKQIDYCWGVYSDAVKRGKIKTTFYGYNARNSVRVVGFYKLTD